MAEGCVNSSSCSKHTGDGDGVRSDLSSTAEVRFVETTEGRRLAYHKLEGSSPGVIFIHGLNSNMNGEKANGLERFCREQGIGYIRFDLSGHGQSSLEFKDCNITMWLEDLISVISLLTNGPQILVGSSLGGWLMFLYTMRNPDSIHGLIGIAAAPDFTQVLWNGLSQEEKQEVKKSGVCKVPSPYSDEPYELTLQLIQDGDKYSIMSMPGIEYMKSPVRLFHGEQDQVVPVSTALKIMQKLQCPVSLKTVQDGDHRLSRPQDIELITTALAELLSPQDTREENATDQED